MSNDKIAAVKDILHLFCRGTRKVFIGKRDHSKIIAAKKHFPLSPKVLIYFSHKFKALLLGFNM